MAAHFAKSAKYRSAKLFSLAAWSRSPLAASHCNLKSPVPVTSWNRNSLSSSAAMLQKQEFQYNWIDGAEHLDMYSPEGYHPVMVGDILHGRYRIVDKLGYGGYSTVWLARDLQPQCHSPRLVALKIGIPKSQLKETTILRALGSPASASSLSLPSDHLLAGRVAIPPLLDEFRLTSPNGTHPCYTTLPAQCDLAEATSRGLFPLAVARALSAGLVLAVAYVHSKGFCHGDIHLRNVFSKLPSNLDDKSPEEFIEEFGEPETVKLTLRQGGPLPPNAPARAVLPVWLGKYANEFQLPDAKIMLGDFGEAFETSETRLAQDSNAPLASRPPEAHLDPQSQLKSSVDIWSLAIAIWDIIGTKPIFNASFATADEVTADMIDVLGPLPQEWYSKWAGRHEVLESHGQRRVMMNALPPLGQHFDNAVQHYRQKKGMGVFKGEERAAILELLDGMLKYRPEERLSIHDILRSEWMVRWALPEFKNIPA